MIPHLGLFGRFLKREKGTNRIKLRCGHLHGYCTRTMTGSREVSLDVKMQIGHCC